MNDTEICQALLNAWLRYHKNASPDQVEGAKKRIVMLLGG
jgi:hypothetical protein